MAGPWNPGVDIMQAYFRGKQIRQQREKTQAEVEIANQIAADRQQKMEDDWNIALQKQKDLAEWRKLQAKNQESELVLKEFESLKSRGEAYQKGWLELIDPSKGFIDPKNFRETKAGTAARMEAEAAKLKAEAVVPAAVQQAVQIAEGTAPVKVETAKQIYEETTVKDREDKQTFEALENQKDRQLRAEEGAKNRATRIQAANIAHAAGQDTEGNYIASHMKGIQYGDITMEDLKALPAKERSQIIHAARGEGLKILTFKEQEKLADAQNLERYYIKSKELQERIAKKGNWKEAFTDGKITTLMGELDAIAKQFSVAVAGDKSILTERELPRIAQGTIGRNPAGWTALNPLQNTTKINNEANLKRVQEFKKLYHERINTLLGPNLTPAQREAVKEKFGLMSEEEPPKTPKGRKNPLPPGVVPVE